MQKQPLRRKIIQKNVRKKKFLRRLKSGTTIASVKVKGNKKVLFRNYKNSSYN